MTIFDCTVLIATNRLQVYELSVKHMLNNLAAVGPFQVGRVQHIYSNQFGKRNTFFIFLSAQYEVGDRLQTKFKIKHRPATVSSTPFVLNENMVDYWRMHIIKWCRCEPICSLF